MCNLGAEVRRQCLQLKAGLQHAEQSQLPFNHLEVLRPDSQTLPQPVPGLGRVHAHPILLWLCTCSNVTHGTHEP